MAVDILYIQYSNPGAYPPVLNGSHLLAEAGFRILMAGISGGGLDAMTIPPHPRISVQMLPWVVPGWRQKLQYVRFCQWTTWLATRYRPRWVYACDALACVPAAILRRLGFRVLYHEHDHPGTPTSRFMGAVLAARRWVARHCPCVLPNSGRAANFRKETGAEQVFVVWNSPLRLEVGPPANPPEGITRVLYHGSIVPDRVPLSLIEAINRSPEQVRLRIVGYETIGAIGYIDRLKALASKRGVAGRVEFWSALPRHELLHACHDVHVGLGFMPAQGDLNMENMIGASVKVFDYLSRGVPLLVSDRPDWRALYVDGGFGLACDPNDPDGIAQAFRWFHENPAEAKKMGERGRQRILSEWNYDTQFSPIMKILQAPLVRRTA